MRDHGALKNIRPIRGVAAPPPGRRLYRSGPQPRTPAGTWGESRAPPRRLWRLPRCRIYYGLIRYSGEFYEGKHEPIITKKLFDEVQEVMARKSKPKTKELKPYAYRGFFRCGECGCFITTETQKGHNYLRCTKRKNPCLQRYVREDVITSSIQTELQKVSLPDDWADWMTGELEKEKNETAQSSELFAQKTRDEVAAIDEKLDKLMTAYLENALSLAEYQTAKNKLVNQK